MGFVAGFDALSAKAKRDGDRGYTSPHLGFRGEKSVIRTIDHNVESLGETVRVSCRATLLGPNEEQTRLASEAGLTLRAAGLVVEQRLTLRRGSGWALFAGSLSREEAVRGDDDWNAYRQALGAELPMPATLEMRGVAHKGVNPIASGRPLGKAAADLALAVNHLVVELPVAHPDRLVLEPLRAVGESNLPLLASPEAFEALGVWMETAGPA